MDRIARLKLRLADARADASFRAPAHAGIEMLERAVGAAAGPRE